MKAQDKNESTELKVTILAINAVVTYLQSLAGLAVAFKYALRFKICCFIHLLYEVVTLVCVTETK